jgi:uncharacterized membrane protein YhaH (DUF805 family)
MSYLFGFSGRINRAKIWLFLLICIIVEILLFVIAAHGFDWSATTRSFIAMAKDMQPGDRFDFTKVAAPRMIGHQSYAALAAIALLWLTTFFASLAILTKRLHDRNKSAWWLILYVLVPFALQIYSFSTGPSVADALMSMRTPLGHAAYGIAVLINLWAFVELYFFRGTRGENRYGADPLA